MKPPSLQATLAAAFTLCMIGWIVYLRKLNSTEMHFLEKKLSAPADLSTLHTPHHPEAEADVQACFTLINNGLYDVFVQFQVIHPKHGVRLTSGAPDDILVPAEKSNSHWPSIRTFACLTATPDEQGEFIFNVHFDTVNKQEKAYIPPISIIGAGSTYYLCPEKTTSAITAQEEQVKPPKKYQHYNATLFSSGSIITDLQFQRAFCEPPRALRGAKG